MPANANEQTQNALSVFLHVSESSFSMLIANASYLPKQKPHRKSNQQLHNWQKDTFFPVSFSILNRVWVRPGMSEYINHFYPSSSSPVHLFLFALTHVIVILQNVVCKIVEWFSNKITQFRYKVRHVSVFSHVLSMRQICFSPFRFVDIYNINRRNAGVKLKKIRRAWKTTVSFTH